MTDIVIVAAARTAVGKFGGTLSKTPAPVLGASGHIAGVVNPPAKNKRSHWIGPDGKLPEDPQQWFGAAKEQPGSWWTDWSRWLKGHAGKQVPAPKAPGNARYRPIEPAPGRYVKAKA